MYNILGNIWKIILILIITGIGGAITCGGNLYIPSLLGFRNGEYGPDYLIFFWIMEILSIFLLSIYLLFWLGDIKKKNITYMIVKILMSIGFLSALYIYLSRY